MSAYTGKSVLVTGGSSGIGAALVRRAAADGGRVVIADVNAAAGEALAKEVGARFQRTDVTEFDEVKAAIDTAAQEHEGLDVLHLNAGLVGPSESGVEQGVPYALDFYRRTVAVNLDGIVYGVHAALPLMRHRPGASIVVTASVAGVAYNPHSEVYTATKHAAVAFMRSLSQTFAEDPVTFNTLCPGLVDTSLIDPLREWLPHMDMGTLGNRPLPPEAVADLAERVIAERGDGDAWMVSTAVSPTRYPFEAEQELVDQALRTSARV